MFLGTDELKKLTGSTRKTKQMQWLKQHGIKWTVSFKNELNVSRLAVEAKHGGVQQAPSQWEPNPDVFRRA